MVRPVPKKIMNELRGLVDKRTLNEIVKDCEKETVKPGLGSELAMLGGLATAFAGVPATLLYVLKDVTPEVPLYTSILGLLMFVYGSSNFTSSNYNTKVQQIAKRYLKEK